MSLSSYITKAEIAWYEGDFREGSANKVLSAIKFIKTLFLSQFFGTQLRKYQLGPAQGKEAAETAIPKPFLLPEVQPNDHLLRTE